MNKIKINFNKLFLILNIINLILLAFTVKFNILICISFVIAYLVINYIADKRKINSFFKINKYLLIVLFAVNLLFFIFNKLNIMENFGSVHEIKNFILSTKEWGIFVFVLVEFLQVVALPIPGFITILAGVNIWGVGRTILISSSSVIIASCFAFIIGRIWGTKAIIKLMGNKKYDTYKNILNKHSKLYLSLMFILPFFPDDLLCILAGTTDMKFYQFLLISLFTMPISIIVTAFLVVCFIIFFQKSLIKNVIFFLIIIVAVLIIIMKNRNKLKKIWISSFEKIKCKFFNLKNKISYKKTSIRK